MQPCVYFVRAVFKQGEGRKSCGFALWRFGRTVDVGRRLTVLRAACPVPLELAGAITCPTVNIAREAESQLLEQFGPAWFPMSVHQTRGIMALIRDWPIEVPLAAYLEDPPRVSSELDLAPIRSEFVPLAALHEARRETRIQRERAEKAERAARVMAERTDSIFGQLTDRVHGLITTSNQDRAAYPRA